MKHIMIIILLFSLTNCLGAKVGVDDETLETIADIFDTDSDNNEITADDVEDRGTERSSARDTAGVIETLGHDLKALNRTFMGTYQLDELYSYCTSSATIPYTIRMYSDNVEPYIDIETETGELIWIADVFEDETFSFTISYLDSLSQPTNTMSCTCEIEPSYNGYYNDEVQCGCAGSQNSCTIYWSKIGS